jgi:hypothetical protein
MFDFASSILIINSRTKKNKLVGYSYAGTSRITNYWYSKIYSFLVPPHANAGRRTAQPGEKFHIKELSSTLSLGNFVILLLLSPTQ